MLSDRYVVTTKQVNRYQFVVDVTDADGKILICFDDFREQAVIKYNNTTLDVDYELYRVQAVYHIALLAIKQCNKHR